MEEDKKRLREQSQHSLSTGSSTRSLKAKIRAVRSDNSAMSIKSAPSDLQDVHQRMSNGSMREREADADPRPMSDGHAEGMLPGSLENGAQGVVSATDSNLSSAQPSLSKVISEYEVAGCGNLDVQVDEAITQRLRGGVQNTGLGLPGTMTFFNEDKPPVSDAATPPGQV